ncbi:MAG TPA: polysaccharide deacetylase family protein [Rariglobus sp.]
MMTSPRLIRRASHAFLVLLLIGFCARAQAAVGDTRIAKWKDDRVAAFLLMFDDGWPGQVQVAIPEMQKRGLTGTFYMVPEKGEYKAYAAKWAAALQGGGVVYGNHTLTHGGIQNLEHGRKEIGECARILRELQPGKPNRLLSFAQPGVGPGKWNINREELALLLKDYNLVDRPPFSGHGAVYHWKTLDEMTALVDKAVASKGMEYLVIHGVERIGAQWQDFWPLKQDIFLPLLDVLKTRSDAHELWVTDHISQHQYATERDTASVKTLKVIANGIQLELKSSADPVYYDQPLTLVTEVPATWRECNISQGAAQTRATAKDGVLTFDALPNGPAISLWPISAR